MKRFNFREKFVNEWFDFNSKLYFVLICVLMFIILFLKKAFLIEEITAFEVLDERGEMGIFNIFFALEYAVVPVFFAWRITVTTFLIWVGCFMFGYKLTFNKLWKLVLMLEIVFLIPEILKLLWFMTFETNPDYWDIRAFYPFSLMNLFDYEAIGKQWHYPLKALNIFEIGYWFLLVYGIYYLSGKSLKIAYAIVSSSYLLFFFIWLVYYVLSYR